ncbi:hypothetical protein BGC07_13535 [Piscirickettsia litoralis]|uniref:MFS transporter n=1 Tax=Piscirickettsia litoralis TaxID=1891921 RepID=A0ABX3A674_9GAMM|nr:hypothetical protein BGC07_13535 [Piscirickettsia litoralis]
MFYAALLILFSTLGQATLVMYLPAFSEVSLAYRITAAQIAQSVTLYLAFFCPWAVYFRKFVGSLLAS